MPHLVMGVDLQTVEEALQIESTLDNVQQRLMVSFASWSDPIGKDESNPASRGKSLCDMQMRE